MPQGEYPRIANKEEILRMYDRIMMQYVNYILNHSSEINEGLSKERLSVMKWYSGKIDVLRIILGFSGNMEDE